MTYFFNIQYDHDIEDTHIFTAHTEGANVDEAIANFRDIYKTERILSVEMVSPSHIDKITSRKEGDFRKYMDEEDEIRERVIYALRETERRNEQ